MASTLCVPTQLHKYEQCFISFMGYFDECEYELGDTFTRDHLLEIQPEDMYKYFCLKTFVRCSLMS